MTAHAGPALAAAFLLGACGVKAPPRPPLSSRPAKPPAAAASSAPDKTPPDPGSCP